MSFFRSCSITCPAEVTYVTSALNGSALTQHATRPPPSLSSEPSHLSNTHWSSLIVIIHSWRVQKVCLHDCEWEITRLKITQAHCVNYCLIVLASFAFSFYILLKKIIFAAQT